MRKIDESYETRFDAVGASDTDARLETPAQRGHATSDSGGVFIARLHGFDVNDKPIIAHLEQLPGELIAARTTVPLTQQMIGADVVLVFEQGKAWRPIIIGVLQSGVPPVDARKKSQAVSILADDERFLVDAEREIVLRCGDASITLTRCGKVIIKGKYVLSRSEGYNKIKGAVIDLN